jgi:hypothetical protein
MRHLALLLLTAPAWATEPVLTYTNDISVQTVLTRDKADWCRGRMVMFDIDGLQRAYYGCWQLSQGFAHIEMADGSRRVMPMTSFSRINAVATQPPMEPVR